MSDVVSLAARRSALPKLRIGLLRLSDGAPVMVAQELGFFADEGVDIELVIEPSWANIADKLAFGFIDAAVIVPPLAFAVELGMRGMLQPMIIPYAISSGGNTVTLATPLAQEIRDRAARDATTIVAAIAATLRERRMTLGIVHAYSTHHLLLRYWLATAGIEAGRDVKLTVVPPAHAVEALSAGHVAGFCAGAPWGEVARRAGVGETVAASRDIWQNAPEKALAVRGRWAEDHPDAQAAALRALLRAAKFCDDAANASYTAAVLSRPKYLKLDPHAILAGLPGGAVLDNTSVFYRGGTTFPWRSHGLWFLNEMRRWGLVHAGVDLRAVAERVYRPDLYRAAIGSVGEAAPLADWKCEGAHDAAWNIAASPAPITLPPDRFCDGAVFDPEMVAPPVPAEGALHNN